MNQVLEKQEELLKLIEWYRKTQMKRLKHEEVGSKNSMLYLGLLHETKNLLLHIVNLTKAQRDFVENANK
jgi:Na+/phosphate symporter